MQTLIKVSIFSVITFVTAQLPSLAPKQEVKNTAQFKVIETGIAEQKEVVTQAPTEPEPQVNIVKTSDITDGVWEWKDLVAKYFPESEVNNALRVMSGENGSGDPTRIGHNRNGSSDYSLFQINSCHAERVGGDLSKLLDPETNVRVASEIWKEQGWSPWVAARKLGIQ